MPTPIQEYLRPLPEWVINGKIPPVVNLDHSLDRPWQGLVFHPGSANHGLISHASGYIRERLRVQDGSLSRDYLLARGRDELRGGLWWTEPLVVTYGGVTVGPWSIVWWAAWVTGDTEMVGVSGAWLERSMLLLSMHTRVGPGGELEIYAPGARRDWGATRRTLAAMMSRLLGYRSSLDDSPKHDWPGGLALRAMRHANGLPASMDRVSKTCRSIIHDKAVMRYAGEDGYRLHSMVPIRWRCYGPDQWVSYFLADNRHKLAPQDPAQLLGGWIGGKPVEAYPFTSGDPRETGWGHTVVEDRGSEVFCAWMNRGELAKRVTFDLPEDPDLVIDIGPTAIGDELGDLPSPLPGPPGVPATSGSGRPKPKPTGGGGSQPDDGKRAELEDLARWAPQRAQIIEWAIQRIDQAENGTDW